MRIRPCLVCHAASDTSIPEGRVCQTHAIEFYTELVKYAVDRARMDADEPMVKKELFVNLTKLPDKPGPRPRRAYVKRAPRWFKAAERHARVAA